MSVLSNRAGKQVKLNVSVKSSSSYRIYIHRGNLSQFLEEIFTIHKQRKIFILIDSKVSTIYRQLIEKTSEECGVFKNLFFFVFPEGEKSKNIQIKTEFDLFMLKQKADRDSLILAFGGGVTGDIAGFSAATIFRGIRYIQIPTTLISMVDSSVGGKTGIDTPYGKNFIGSFYHPEAVYIDPALLMSLSPETFTEGIAEVIKSAVIGDGALFCYLQNNITKILKQDPNALTEIIKRSLKVKQKAVEKDEKEKSGYRRILNFGHTIAHAVEQISDYKLSHGFCVGLGMSLETEAAAQKGFIKDKDKMNILNLITVAGLPVSLPESLKTLKNIKKMTEIMKMDKKASQRKIMFSIPRKIGKMCPGKSRSYRVEFSSDFVEKVLCQDEC